MKFLIVLGLAMFSGLLIAGTPTPKNVTFETQDGGIIHADYYPATEMAVVLAHDAVFGKSSW